MDLSQPVTYGPITFQPLTAASGGGKFSGYSLESVDFSAIPTSIASEKIPLGDGYTLSDAFLGGRTITIEANVFGTSQADLNDKLSLFRRMFSPRTTPYNLSWDNDNLRFEFSRATIVSSAWTSGYIPLVCYARPVAQPWHRALTMRDADAGEHVLAVGARLMAYDPFFYAAGALSAGISISAVTDCISPGTWPDSCTALGYRGDAPTMRYYWLVTLSGTGPSLLRLASEAGYVAGDGGNPNGDLWLNLSGCGAGDYSVSGPRRVVYGPTGLVTGAILATSIWAPLGQERFSATPTDMGAFYAASSYAHISSVRITSMEAFF